jgi:hypothetical protein
VSETLQLIDDYYAEVQKEEVGDPENIVYIQDKVMLKTMVMLDKQVHAGEAVDSPALLHLPDSTDDSSLGTLHQQLVAALPDQQIGPS